MHGWWCHGCEKYHTEPPQQVAVVDCSAPIQLLNDWGQTESPALPIESVEANTITAYTCGKPKGAYYLEIPPMADLWSCIKCGELWEEERDAYECHKEGAQKAE